MTPTLNFPIASSKTVVSTTVSSAARESALWDKPVFRAPPLTVNPRIPEIQEFNNWLKMRNAAARSTEHRAANAPAR